MLLPGQVVGFHFAVSYKAVPNTLASRLNSVVGAKVLIVQASAGTRLTLFLELSLTASFAKGASLPFCSHTPPQVMGENKLGGGGGGGRGRRRWHVTRSSGWTLLILSPRKWGWGRLVLSRSECVWLSPLWNIRECLNICQKQRSRAFDCTVWAHAHWLGALNPFGANPASWR